MTAVVEWLPLWLRIALAVVVFLMGSIGALAACQAAKVLGMMALEAGFSAASHLIDRLTRLFIACGCGLARGIGLSLRSLVRSVRDAIARQKQTRRMRRLWRAEFRNHFQTFEAFRAAFERAATQESPSLRERASPAPPPRPEASPRPKPPPAPPPPRKPPPDPEQLAFSAACRLLGLPETSFTPEQLSRGYRARIHGAHPDRGGSHQQAAALNAARDLIKKRKGWT